MTKSCYDAVSYGLPTSHYSQYSLFGMRATQEVFRSLGAFPTALTDNGSLAIPKCYGRNTWAPLLGVVVVLSVGFALLPLGRPSSRRSFSGCLPIFTVAGPALVDGVAFLAAARRMGADLVRLVVRRRAVFDAERPFARLPWAALACLPPPVYPCHDWNGSGRTEEWQDCRARCYALGGKGH